VIGVIVSVVYVPGDDFSEAKVGDIIVSYYGDSGVIVGESDRKYYWSVRYPSGRIVPVMKYNRDRIVSSVEVL
jgi:hypothetical protein